MFGKPYFQLNHTDHLTNMTMSEFHAFRKETARAFLQSAVLIDEEVSWDRGAPQALEETLISPGKKAHKIDDSASVTNAIRANTKHPLFASDVIDGFANQGIVCGVICPKTNTPWMSRVLLACRKADIVILDWNLKISDSTTGESETADNPGVHATNIVAALAKVAIETNSLRLIAIYTGEEKSNNDFLVQISTAITALCKEQSIEIKSDLDRAMLSAGPMTVVITRKQIGKAIDGHLSEGDLPDHLITKFSEINSGLLKNAAISAVAALRRKTFALINLFPEKMDAGYVAHRLSQQIPGDAEEHFINVVASELHELLESSKDSESLTAKNLADWATDLNNSTPLNADFFGVGFAKASESLSMIFEAGFPAILEDKPATLDNKIFEWMQKDGKKPKKLHDIAANFGKVNEAEVANRLWAERTVMRSHFEKPAPFLRPGTLVRNRDGYLMCIQQACDCRRVPKKGRAFLFLPLTIVTSKPDVVLQHNNEWLQLSIGKPCYEVMKKLFSPEKDKDAIRATKRVTKTGVRWIFSDQDGRQYAWVSALKPFHAQRIMHRFAEGISRVGVVESEWLHLLNK